MIIGKLVTWLAKKPSMQAMLETQDRAEQLHKSRERAQSISYCSCVLGDAYWTASGQVHARYDRYPALESAKGAGRSWRMVVCLAISKTHATMSHEQGYAGLRIE